MTNTIYYWLCPITSIQSKQIFPSWQSTWKRCSECGSSALPYNLQLLLGLINLRTAISIVQCWSSALPQGKQLLSPSRTFVINRQFRRISTSPTQQRQMPIVSQSFSPATGDQIRGVTVPDCCCDDKGPRETWNSRHSSYHSRNSALKGDGTSAGRISFAWRQ